MDILTFVLYFFTQILTKFTLCCILDKKTTKVINMLKNGLRDLGGIDFGIYKAMAMNQNWSDGYVYNGTSPRMTEALLLFCGSDGKLTDAITGNVQIFPSGSLVHIPKGSRYTWTFRTVKEGVSSKLIEFLPVDSDGNVITVSDCISEIPQPYSMAYARYFDLMISVCSKPVYSHSGAKAVLYEFIDVLAEDLKRGSFGGDECIYKGVRYLENDPLQKKSIKEIASMCNISENYFERLFKEYAGVTPSEYRIQNKIERAKRLLDSSVTDIKQTAFLLGYDDCAYFCRVFKKITGLTPSQYRDRIKK